MPVIYYSYYTPDENSIPANTQLEHLLGRKLLAAGLKELFDLPVTSDNIDRLISLSENDKPYLSDYPGIHFNITHCTGLVACAFDTHPIGIDAEKIGYYPEILINKVLTDPEKSLLQEEGTDRAEWFWRLWTLKEAYVKKTGTGVDTDLKSFSFDFQGPSVICSDKEVSCFQKKLSKNHIISVICDNSLKDPESPAERSSARAFQAIDKVSFTFQEKN